MNWEDDNDITALHQDGGRTLKVFVNKVKPETGALEALEEWLGPEPPQEPVRDTKRVMIKDATKQLGDHD